MGQLMVELLPAYGHGAGTFWGPFWARGGQGGGALGSVPSVV